MSYLYSESVEPAATVYRTDGLRWCSCCRRSKETVRAKCPDCAMDLGVMPVRAPEERASIGLGYMIVLGLISAVCLVIGFCVGRAIH